ncbi:hypothetical protein [Chitinophaga sancti]|nr:hypothetical protein [Chitinophaga sancti]WQD61489.1 hypothetical protein U0033_26795 [Chitinophaga sancti]WQG92954.1 hypothetical protein SR876_15645 [Chitinophaga sancti]
MRRISILMALAIAGCHQENKTSQQEDTATTSSTTLSGAANPGAAFESKKVQEGVKILFDTVIATKQTEAFIKAKYPYNTPGIAFTHNDEDITGDSTTTRVSSFHIPGYDITYKFEFKEEFEAGKSTIFVNKKQITHIIDESGSTVNDCGFISWGGSPMETCTINGQQYVILSGTNEWASGMFTNLCYGIIVPLAENNTTAYLVSSYGQLSFYPKGVANSAKLTFIQCGRLEEDEEEDELDSVRIQIAQLDIRQ